MVIERADGEIVFADADEKKRSSAHGANRRQPCDVRADVTSTEDIVRVLNGGAYVVNRFPYQFEENVLDVIVEGGDLIGVDLNAFDFDEIFSRSDEFAEAGCSLWFANGRLVSTIALGMVGCEEFDEVEDMSYY